MLRPLLLSLMLFVAGSFSAAADPKQEAENLVKTYEANFNKKDAAGIAAMPLASPLVHQGRRPSYQ